MWCKSLGLLVLLACCVSGSSAFLVSTFYRSSTQDYFHSDLEVNDANCVELATWLVKTGQIIFCTQSGNIQLALYADNHNLYISQQQYDEENSMSCPEMISGAQLAAFGENVRTLDNDPSDDADDLEFLRASVSQYCSIFHGRVTSV